MRQANISDNSHGLDALEPEQRQQLQQAVTVVRRRHSAIGMISPVEYENRITQTAQAA
jgi:hypothetical protein